MVDSKYSNDTPIQEDEVFWGQLVWARPFEQYKPEGRFRVKLLCFADNPSSIGSVLDYNKFANMLYNIEEKHPKFFQHYKPFDNLYVKVSVRVYNSSIPSIKHILKVFDTREHCMQNMIKTLSVKK